MPTICALWVAYQRDRDGKGGSGESLPVSPELVPPSTYTSVAYVSGWKCA